MKIKTKNAKETKKVGYQLGQAARGGEVFALIGELGAGKTCFLQGLAQGLGVKGRVNSPTFNIWKVYRARGGRIFCHLDAYRLHSAKDLLNLGINEYLSRPDVVVAIEWAEKVKSIWPKKTRAIEIKRLSEEERMIEIK